MRKLENKRKDLAFLNTLGVSFWGKLEKVDLKMDFRPILLLNLKKELEK